MFYFVVYLPPTVLTNEDSRNLENYEDESDEDEEEEVLVIRIENPVDDNEEEDEDDDDNNEIFDNLEDEVANSQRYLTINLAPNYRWSEGMLPTIIATPSSASRLRRQASVSESEESGDETSKHDKIVDQEKEEEEEEEETESELESGHHRPGIVITTASVPNVRVERAVGLPPRDLRSQWIAERLKHLAKAYSDRGSFVKKAIEDLSGEEDDTDNVLSALDECDTNLGPESEADKRKRFNELNFGDEWQDQPSSSGLRSKLLKLVQPYEPQSGLNIAWLAIMSLAFIYNAIYIPYRIIFPNQEQARQFMLCDGLADLVYLLDCFWFKTRHKFIRNGEWISDPSETRLHYFRQPRFRHDFFALVPFDWALATIVGSHYYWPDGGQRLARVNRLLQWDAFHEFFWRVDTITAYPYVPRIVHTLLYKLYVIHIGACVYYYARQVGRNLFVFFSKMFFLPPSSWYQGFGSTPWTYDNEGGAYLRCFYFSFRTTTSIGGRMPKPSNDFERTYMMIAWLLGVFIFATVIGQIRDIVATASRNSDYYRDVLNKMAAYLRSLTVPGRLQKRVRFWLMYTWEHQATFNEVAILRVLPTKMQADIALSVHYHTLARVDLFRNIDRSVLRELVLRMRPILYLPGDYICRKGDIGQEMYIVNKGRLDVMGPGNVVLVTLDEGSVFGEIAVLGLEGLSRRTADVRAAGYVQLFALSKSDLWETLKNYPEYEAVLKKKVQRMARDKLRAQKNSGKDRDKQDGSTGVLKVPVEPIVKSRPRTPRLFSAVMEIVRPDSKLKAEFVSEVTTISRMNTLSNQNSIEEEVSEEELVEEEDKQT